MSESEEDYLTDESDGEKEKASGNEPIMSIFASYYGIEDTNQPEPEVMGTIDDSNFDHVSYVKNVLQHESVEGMVAKDSELVHEIRNLDGEMQKLVYDNYNKFITATETIKEMKTDVFSMDSDMISVRSTMVTIAEASRKLDGVFEEKRGEVDKLVRIRRLLDRLGFLSELPEKLAVMINSGLYKEAVVLYNKTISVLTRHSHVLSFKKIKERTEEMMGDLTIKVIDLLEDPTLDTNRLTQYITILRMMKAPKEKVLKKFIHAHEVRSKKLLDSFAKSVQDSAAGEAGVTDGVSMATHMREFHQTMLASLIEACMGFKELYSEKDGSEADRAKALPGFLTMLNKMSTQYESSLLGAFTKVFSSVNRMCSTLHYEVDEDKMDSDFLSESKALESLLTSAQRANTAEDASENRFAIAELRNSLIMLSRLCIQDVKYLQSVMDGLAPPSSSPTASSPVQFANQFTGKLMDVLHTHTQHVLQHDLQVYVQEMCAYAHKVNLISQAGVLCSAHANSSAQYTTVLAKYVGKGALSSALHFMKTCEDFLFTTICEVFTQTVLSFKPVVEIYESIMKDTQDSIQDLVRQFIRTLCQTILKKVGEAEGGMGVDQHTLSVLFSEHEELVLTDETGEIIHEICTSANKQTTSGSHEEVKQVSFLAHLLSAGLLRRFHRSLVDNFEEIVHRQDLVLSTLSSQFKIKKSGVYQGWIERSSQYLLNQFVDHNQQLVSDATSLTTYATYTAHYPPKDRDNDGEGGGDEAPLQVSITPALLDVVQYIESTLLCVCMVFGESPPIPTPKSDGARRGVRQSMVSSNTLTNQSMHIHLDMDRLFSQRVLIHTSLPPDGSLDMVMVSMYKAVYKSLLESVRVMTLSREAYMVLQANISLLKQVSTYHIKDLREVDILVDNLLSALFSRYCGANDLAAATDNLESTLIGKAVSDSMLALGETSQVLAKR